MVAAPAAAGARPAETGTPAPDAEPPAPEGEAPARETPQVPDDVQEYLDASRGKGAPLPDATRKVFEAKFQRPFDDVRIHDDSGADDAAKKIDALAFTRGNDIYFRSGAYDPTSPEGKKLLAHELAHVVQQRPGVNRKPAPGLGGAVIRRAGGKKKEHDPKGGGTKKFASRDGNEVNFEDEANPRLKLANVRVPKYKVKLHQGKELYWNKKERSDAYEKTWREKVSAELKGAVQKRGGQAAPPYRYQFGKTKKEQRYYIGNVDDIAYALSVLPWDKEQEAAGFQIDHKHEFQLGGPDNDIDNLWLYEQGINMSSGPTIDRAITDDITKFLEAVRPELIRVPSLTEVKLWAVKEKVRFGSAVANVTSQSKAAAESEDNPKHYWKREEIAKIDGDQSSASKESLKPLEELADENRDKAVGAKEQIVVYSKRGGGKAPRLIKRDPKDGKLDNIYGHGFVTTNGTYSRNSTAEPGVGSVTIGLFRRDKDGKIIRDDDKKAVIEPTDKIFPIDTMPGVDWGGVVNITELAKISRALKSPKTSPIVLSSLDFDLDDGLQARGVIPQPSIPLLEKIQISVFVSGADVGLQALINGGDLKLPGPFKVSGGALMLTASVVEGLKVEGTVDFEIQKVATGFIRARAGTSTGFALDAELQFDKKMFDGDAKIKGSYEDGKWAVEGTLGVGPGKIKGIKKASAAVKVTEDTVTATGEFETSLKGVDKGTIGFKYNQATGMEITGEVILGKGIPGIKSGKLDATIKEGPTGHSLSGDVTLEPSVPGLTGAVTGHYEDGAFLVEADLGYDKGLAKGSVKVGLTNQAVGAEGKPAGPPKPDGSLTVYGGGTVTLTLTPWLQGTVGLKLTPKGEIEVTGEVALPSAFEVFKERALDKQLVSIGVDLPIIGVAVAGQRIGIFATIKGGVSISAGIGPGQLRDVALKVTYNPDKPDDTTVSGRGSFAVPAHASLRLSVDGGLGAGIPVVSATAGVTVYGEIGVAGEASAGVVVSWSPRTGIVLDARGEIFVEPKFKFGIEAFVDVSADLWITTIELYHEKWKLAEFEYGSNLRFGLALPIHYESLKPFDISFDQIQWTYPHIEPTELLGGLMKQLVG